MSEGTRIRFLRDWGPGHPAGHVEDMPSHIAKALCGGDDPFAVEADQAGEYVHRAVTTTRSTVRPKRKKTTKKAAE